MKKIIALAAFYALSANVVIAQPVADTRPTAYMVANAHLDTQWNWDVQATIGHHIRTTLVQNLELMRLYPDYIFNFEGAVKYAWMKEYYPEYWQELTQRIRENRWHLAGSSWDANEAIICSPESWIRNILLGQTFYRQEFGRESNDVFLPDCFGFPYYLPTTAAHCGLIGFSSQKLMWRTNPFYEGGRKYPFSVGLWQGIDGSRIMMAHGFNYSQRYEDQDLSHNKSLQREVAESPLGIAFRYYGTGDTGGSPNIESVRAVMRGMKGDGPLRIVSAPSDTIYRLFQPYDQHPELPVFDGELPMDVHGNACYTSQAAMKLYNRQLEHLGDAAERTAVVADWMGTRAYPIEEMTANWRRVIWHQFHDDITGTSIPRAYEFSWNDELIGLKRFSSVLATSVDGIARQLDTRVSGTPLVLYNAEAFPVETVAAIDLPDANSAYAVSDASGKSVRSQVVTATDGSVRLLFETRVPAIGYAVYGLKTTKKQKANSSLGIANGSEGKALENSRYRLMVDANGDVTSIYDKQYGRELIAEGRALRLVVFDDCTSNGWPAWEIQKATLNREPVPVHDGVNVSLVEDGALRHTLRITKRYGESQITQFVSLYEGALADRIDFRHEVEWRSLNALLKAEMPFSVANEEATYDIGLGGVRRGNNRANNFEVYSHEWTDLTDRSGNYGVTILNDSRYGWDKPTENILRLSLLYSPKCDQSAFDYQARQDFGFHEFTFCLVGHNGQLNPVQAVRQSTMLNSSVKTFRAEKHAGALGRTFSFIQSDNDNVLVRTLKRAEVTNEYVVRVHEIGGSADQQAHLTFPAPIVRAVRADGTERELGVASFSGNSLTVDVRRFGLGTYKVVLAPNSNADRPHDALGSSKKSVKCKSIYLPFDRKAMSTNAFRNSVNFESGYSYAAELLPADRKIENDGISFRLGEYDTHDALGCKGDTLLLPADAPYTHLYLLTASDRDDRDAAFRFIGKKIKADVALQTVYVPYYTGFVGQWGHEGQTSGYLKPADIAYVGTHRHSSEGDQPYEFTYMFRICLDIPRGAEAVVLPEDSHVVLFAATAADDISAAVPAAPFFITSNRTNDLPTKDGQQQLRPNLLSSAKVVAASGHVNEAERPEFIADGREDTKWCDTHRAPNYVDFDLGEEHEVSSWAILNAGQETTDYITRAAILQGRRSANEEWKTLDLLDGNHADRVQRSFSPTLVRYVRLLVTGPTQELGGNTTRIYELSLFE